MKHLVRAAVATALIVSGLALWPVMRGSAAPKVTVSGHALGDGVVAPYHGSNNIATVSTSAPSQVFTLDLSFPPAAASGWHFHPGPTFVTVVSGSITTYNENADGTGCTKQTLTAGQSLFEPPGRIHNAINETTTTTKAIYIELGIAPGETDAIGVPDPGNCPGV